MDLFEFMQRTKLSYRKAGEYFDVDHTLLYKYVEGTRNPSLATAVKISKKSKGLIKVEELLNDIPRECDSDSNG